METRPGSLPRANVTCISYYSDFRWGDGEMRTGKWEERGS